MSGLGQPASTTVEAAESRCKSLLFQSMREQAALQFVDAGVARVQVLSPRLFDGIRHGAFSMNKLWDEAIASGRIQAIVHDGPWFHLSRPSDIVGDRARAARPDAGAAEHVRAEGKLGYTKRCRWTLRKSKGEMMEIMKVDRKTVQIEFTLDEFIMFTAITDTADSNFEALTAELWQLTEEGVSDFAEKVYVLQKDVTKCLQGG